MLKVNLMGAEIGVEENTKILDIIKQRIIEGDDIDVYNIIACTVNNEVKDLNYCIIDDCDISYIYTHTEEGMRIYVRGLCLIMLKAFEDLFPKATVTINYALGEALCCEVKNIEIIDEVVVAVREKMKEIINENIEITQKILDKNVVKKMYYENKEFDKIDLLSKSLSEYVKLYFLEDSYGYFYGKMPISTGYIKNFDLKKYEKGVILMYPNKNDLTVIKASHMHKKLHATLQEYEDFYDTMGVRDISELNRNIQSGNLSNILRISEAIHEKKIAQIADIISGDRNKKVILIAGPSSSGKTTFAQRLGIQLMVNKIKPITISVDNYFVEREKTPVDENGQYDFECIEAIDTDLLNEHLTKIIAGEEVEIPEFDFIKGTKKYNGNKIRLGENDVLILEGIHCLNDALTKQISNENKFKIFISAMTVLSIDGYNRISTTDTRLIRRIIRDSKFRAYPILETLDRWESVRRGEDKYIFPYQENADIMFNSSLPYEFSVFRTFIEPQLLTVDNTSKYYPEVVRLYNLLNLFLPIETDQIPINSILREFTGNGCFYR